MNDTILIDGAGAAKLLAIGKSLFYQLDSSGQIPQGVKLNSKRLWSVELLRLWARNGCPGRDSTEWKTVQNAQ